MVVRLQVAVAEVEVVRHHEVLVEVEETVVAEVAGALTTVSPAAAKVMKAVKVVKVVNVKVVMAPHQPSALSRPRAST